MPLNGKPDWEQVQERYKAWWAGEAVDRCLMAIYARRDTGEAPPVLPDIVADRWLDVTYLAALNEYRLNSTCFAGDAFPIWHPGFPGWSFHGVFLGCPISLAETTGWWDPIIAEGELTDHDYRQFTLDPQNPWWMRALEMLRFTAVESKRLGAFPCIGAFGGCGDTLAALRSTGKLLYDVLDCPEYVREFDQYLMRQWMEIYETFYGIMHEAGFEGSTCFFPLWSPGKFYSTHNDFAYMISPKIFNDIFLPSIEMQTRYLDHAIHHVDGIGNFAHIDALCELPRLQALQILPGDGKPSPLHYLPELKKVQAKGKNLHISIPANEVETALQELSIKGLFIETWCESVEEADALLRNADKWSKDHAAL